MIPPPGPAPFNSRLLDATVIYIAYHTSNDRKGESGEHNAAMVRHHIKKKKDDAAKKSSNGASSSSGTSKTTTTKKPQDERRKGIGKRGLEEELVDLDRFAGSSDEGEEEEEEEGGGDRDDDVSDGSGGDDDDDVDVGGSDDDGKGSNSEGDSDDDYVDVYEAGREGDATASDKMRRERKDPVRMKRSDIEGGDGKGVGEEDEEGGDGGGDDGSSEDDYDDEDGTTTPGGRGPRASKSLGMADAMSRILGPSSSSSSAAKGGTTATNTSRSAPSRPVILSKTTTPLQRLQQKLKMEERALRQKRRNRRAENLVAMRLPLAPTAGMSAERLWKQKPKSKKKKTTTTTTTSGERKGEGEEEDDDDDDDPAGDDDDENAVNAMAIANEIEKERAHRRIATRGVVALFNAISKHRSAVAAEAAEREETRRRVREEGRLRGLAARSGRKAEDGDGGAANNARTTKHGFLDMIKMSAAGAEGGTAGVGGGDDAGGRRERGGGRANDDASPSPGGGGRNNGGAKSTGWSALKDDFMMNSKLKVRDFSTCTNRLGSVMVERHFFARSH